MRSGSGVYLLITTNGGATILRETHHERQPEACQTDISSVLTTPTRSIWNYGKSGIRIRLQPKPFQVLKVLLERAGPIG